MLLYCGTERITWENIEYNYNYIKSIAKRILAKSNKQIHRVLLLFSSHQNFPMYFVWQEKEASNSKSILVGFKHL